MCFKAQKAPSSGCSNAMHALVCAFATRETNVDDDSSRPSRATRLSEALVTRNDISTPARVSQLRGREGRETNWRVACRLRRRFDLELPSFTPRASHCRVLGNLRAGESFIARPQSSGGCCICHGLSRSQGRYGGTKGGMQRPDVLLRFFVLKTYFITPTTRPYHTQSPDDRRRYLGLSRSLSAVGLTPLSTHSRSLANTTAW